MARVRAGLSDSYHFEKRYLRKDGTPVWTRLSGSVIRDSETGAPLHLVSQIEDIDVRKKSEAAIAEAETRWSFALASAGQGLWDFDVKRGSSYYSPVWKQMLGYGEDELDTDPDLWLSLVHPDVVYCDNPGVAQLRELACFTKRRLFRGGRLGA